MLCVSSAIPPFLSGNVVACGLAFDFVAILDMAIRDCDADARVVLAARCLSVKLEGSPASSAAGVLLASVRGRSGMMDSVFVMDESEPVALGSAAGKLDAENSVAPIATASASVGAGAVESAQSSVAGISKRGSLSRI